MQKSRHSVLNDYDRTYDMNIFTMIDMIPNWLHDVSKTIHELPKNMI